MVYILRVDPISLGKGRKSANWLKQVCGRPASIIRANVLALHATDAWGGAKNMRRGKEEDVLHALKYGDLAAGGV